MTESLRALLKCRGNDHRRLTRRFEAENGHGWHEPGAVSANSDVSVVIPAFNVGHCLRPVLDALAAQTLASEVVVVDDASTDGTTDIARSHPVVDRLIRLPARGGAATARNVGTAAATGSTIVFLDADVIIPAHVVADIAARATSDAVLVGFRHNIAHGVELPLAPDIRADHRVTWRPPAGRPLMYSGIVLDHPLDGRPLADTRDLVDLGYGRTYYDWDLPRMVVTALLAVPRPALFDVGGFDPEFGRLGWGMEDTHLGAKLIAAGLLIVPLRQAVGFHLDPPDAAAVWQAKLATWPSTLRHYRRLLEAPMPRDPAASFAATAHRLLSRCEVYR
ncbi:glycosyltransferase [Planotetraspora sp. A-T 1434]|uniref:glycosyltransferase n=1 Tax=Planotetraspora sp. A-T 1434 TaxID=2979219 RepID=UPI0021C1B09D|nr:glycosyltransferase [Planotetraspora sp. A-T 1434]MCT9934932.1 glycosyltransferase [Planotetraspora sp. A-T 1434]